MQPLGILVVWSINKNDNMKKTIILLLSATLILPLAAKPGKPGKNGKLGVRGGGGRVDDAAERIALREEQRLDYKDTYTLTKLNQDPTAKDYRPSNLGEYSTHTLNRIKRLNTIGALETSDADQLKDEYAKIVAKGNEFRADGTVTDAEREEYKGLLDGLNDEINALFQTPESGSNRTPIVNSTQLRLSEKIDSAVRTGRISESKANSLRRKLESLERAEERAKSGSELSTRERERLIEEALETRKEIMEELLD